MQQNDSAVDGPLETTHSNLFQVQVQAAALAGVHGLSGDTWQWCWPVTALHCRVHLAHDPASIGLLHHAVWTILRQNGPNHLGLWRNTARSPAPRP